MSHGFMQLVPLAAFATAVAVARIGCDEIANRFAKKTGTAVLPAVVPSRYTFTLTHQPLMPAGQAHDQVRPVFAPVPPKMKCWSTDFWITFSVMPSTAGVTPGSSFTRVI